MSDQFDLLCPICSDNFVTPNQLTQHIEDAHPVDSDNSTKNIFHTLVFGAKNVKSVVSSKAKDIVSQLKSSDIQESVEVEKITRSHWTNGDKCSMEECNKVFGQLTKKHNCRKCGKIFCENCCSSQIKLDMNARHDPLNGTWSRVCFDCFRSRDGYSQEFGSTRSLTRIFKKNRQNTIEKLDLDVNRIESRLEKIKRIYEDESINSSSKREKERSVVVWDDDSQYSNCPQCKKAFNLFSNRKHHCRLCGSVTCAEETCSVLAKVLKNDLIRVCKQCLSTLKRKEVLDKNKEPVPKPQYLTSYEELQNLKKQALELLPQFKNRYEKLNRSNDSNQKASLYHEATALRNQITSLFGQIDALGKRIATLPLTPSQPQTQKIQNNIRISVNLFLQDHMLTLALLPKTLKAAVNQKSTETELERSGSKKLLQDKAKEKEKKEIMETIDVMRTQINQLNTFINQLKKDKKTEDIETLKKNKLEIEQEIKRLEFKMKEL